jgi:hypothetical protein
LPSQILTKTANFFDLYQHICGESEVPDVYHFWCAVALISAALEDRVWYEIYKDQPLKPNLYVCLIGPGSLGKGLAIGHALRLASQSIGTRIYRGKLTYAHLIDVLGKPMVDGAGNEYLQNPRLWLVMDEFKNAVGANKSLAEDIIALLTELYTATNYKLQTGTRTHGEIALENPLLNWLMGSTEVWLRQVLTRDVFESGFVARGCFIFSNYNLNRRIRNPRYPEDYEEVYRHLRLRLWMMQKYSGRFLITPTADRELDRWYNERQCPEDEMLFSTWKRRYEMLVRFAMIRCVADGQQLIIRLGHVSKAIEMVDQIAEFTARLIETGAETFESKPVNEVGRFIKGRKTVKHSDLLRYMRSKKGYNARKVKDSINDLAQEGLIEIGRTPHGGAAYAWITEGSCGLKEGQEKEGAPLETKSR